MRRQPLALRRKHKSCRAVRNSPSNLVRTPCDDANQRKQFQGWIVSIQGQQLTLDCLSFKDTEKIAHLCVDEMR
jgi:hypothetical protein